MKIPLFGPSYWMDSLPAESQSTTGLIPEVIESHSGKGGIIGRLRNTPGLNLFTTLPLSPVIGIWSGEGRVFAVAGSSPSHLYEIHADQSITDYGACGNPLTDQFSGRPNPAQLFYNGNQVMIVNGGYVWVGIGNANYNDLYSLGYGQIGSVSQSFQPNQVGETLQITGGTGWTAGSYTIMAVTNGLAVLSSSPANNGATGGVGTINNVAPVQPNLNVATYTDLAVGLYREGYSDLSIGGIVYSFTDLQIGESFALTGLTASSSSPNQISQSGGTPSLSSAQVGDFISITGGTNFIPGTYQIMAISVSPPTVTATLNQACISGGPGSLGTATLYSLGSNSLVWSASRNFSSGDVGSYLLFTGAGTATVTGGLYPGLYTITGTLHLTIGSWTGTAALLNSSPGPVGASNLVAAEYSVLTLDTVYSASPFFNGDTLVISGQGTAPAGGPYSFNFGFNLGTYTLTVGSQTSLTSIAIQAGNAAQITASPAFTSGNVGNAVYLNQASGFFPGVYTIASVAGGIATLNTACGVAGTTGGTGAMVAPTNGLFSAVVPAGPGVLGTINGVGKAYVSSSTYVVSSAANDFIQSDVGNLLKVTGGTGWTPGNYLISNVQTAADGVGYASLTPPSGVGTLSPAALLASGGQASEFQGPVNPSTGAAAGVPAATGAFMDTYGIVAPPNSSQFYISANNNFLSWSAIDEGAKEGYPDHVLALLMDHELLYLFGDLASTEVWQDTGNANFPFQRMPSGFMHFGLAAQYSVTQLGLNGVAWLAWSAGRGQPIAVYAEGFQPVRVSTHAIEQAWRSYPTVQDAIAYNEIENGHHLWVIHFPAGDATWVYDKTASDQMGMPMWHQRGYLQQYTDLVVGGAGNTLSSGGQPFSAANVGNRITITGGTGFTVSTFTITSVVGGVATVNGTAGTAGSTAGQGYINHRQLQSCHAYGYLQQYSGVGPLGAAHYVGDRNSGNIYVQSLDYFTDAGNPILRQRVCPHVDPTGEERRAFWNSVQLSLEAGLGTVAVTFDYSRDFGHTFLNALTLTATQAGGYQFQRLLWRRLGQSRDFVTRFTSTSNAAQNWTDAFAQLTPGFG